MAGGYGVHMLSVEAASRSSYARHRLTLPQHHIPQGGPLLVECQSDVACQALPLPVRMP